MRPTPTAGALTVAVLGALATAWVGGWTMYVIRRFNGAIARRWIPTLGLGSGRAVIAIQTAGITADFVRGGVLTLIAMLSLDPLARAMVGFVVARLETVPRHRGRGGGGGRGGGHLEVVPQHARSALVLRRRARDRALAVGPSVTARAVTVASPSLPLHTWAEIFVRQLAVQASWNYELLLGTGIGFCLEPALRHLPGGRHGDAYRAAMARESAYFNAHPYLTAVAVGSLARAE